MVLKTLTDRGLILKKGTIVDSTIISAPSSTKNKEKKRDPDAHSVKNRSGKAAGCHHSEQAGQKNQVQAESQANTDQEAVRERTMESKEGEASKIICQGKSRARICGHKGTTPVSKNAIPGSAKTDRQTEYAVRAGELGSG